MGGKRRGKNRRKKNETETVTVTEEQNARNENENENENEKETKEVDIFESFLSIMGIEKPKDMEDFDLFDPCYFLVRAENSDMIFPTTETSVLGEPRHCYQEDLHHIDMVLKDISPHYFPSIINCVDTGTMLSFDYRQVYILGNKPNPRIHHNHDVDVDVDVDNPIHKHTGASLITSSSGCCDWEPFVSPEINCLTVNPAVLFDKIYSFGYPSLCPQVYHPNPSNLWNPLPLPDCLVDTDVSFPLLPDPLNKRIIFHLPCMSMLYAFYPDEKEGAGEWKQLASNFHTWHYIAVAIADNIIFSHPADVHDHGDFLLAYDLNTSAWLHIVWDFSNIDEFLVVYHAIFTLSNKGLMCLASGICGSSVQFLRFRVKRTSDTHLKLTAIDYTKFDIPSATRISDIIFFGESYL